MTRPWSEWAPDWTGETCVIVAAGPSAKDARLDLVRGRAKVLAINESWRLCPWADALYAHDYSWWSRSAPDFGGLKITGQERAAREFGLEHVKVRSQVHTISLDPGEVGSGGNSGFQGLNLAVLFGASRIVLVGFDMRWSEGLHWHGRHPKGLNNPSAELVETWRKRLDAVAPALRGMGVEILNASPSSALTAYSMADLGEVFKK